MSGAQHGTAEGVAPLVEAIHEALVAEAHGLLRGLASRLGEVRRSRTARARVRVRVRVEVEVTVRVRVGVGVRVRVRPGVMPGARMSMGTRKSNSYG